jgi:RNA polymerase sigma-70 factor, ECF subfamily
MVLFFNQGTLSSFVLSNYMETVQTLQSPTVTSDEDRELVDDSIKGDRTSFSRLVLKYRDRILALCTRMLGSADEGEDAAQDTFIKAYGSLEQFRSEAQFSTWIYRIAVNTCRNYQRSWWSRLFRNARKIDRTDESDDDTPRSVELGDTSMLPSKELERKQLAGRLQAALLKLPLIHRELIILRDIDERSYEEIALISGITLGTVKSRLARARSTLQKELRNADDE